MEKNKLFKLLQEWKMNNKPIEEVYQEIAVVVPDLTEKEIQVALYEDPLENNWG